MTTSPRLSFKGYRITEALYRNKDLIKGLLVLITGYSYLSNFDLRQFLLAVAGSGIILIGKLVLDAFDFFFSEVELPVPIVTAK